MKNLLKSLLVATLMVGLFFGFASAKSKTSYKVAWMGVYTQTLDDDLVEAFKLPVDYGAIINEVVEDSPADKVGLKEDEIIISFENKKVRTSEDLIDFVTEKNPGDKVKLVIIDEDGNKKDVEVELGRRKSSDLRKFFWSGDGDDRDLRYYYFGKDSYPFIGVSLSELTDQLGEFFGIKDGVGVLITDVAEDSPAEKAGLKAGDVIIAVDGEEVEDAGDVREIIQDKEIGETAEVSIVRDKKEQLVKVEVAESEVSSKFGNNWNLYIPDLPPIDIQIPKMKGLYHSLDKLDDYRDYSDEYRQQMKELKRELKEMKKELEEIHKKLD
ncbi:MAG: PDZ domain-containing protein [candidate division Zixibacteria bacterium]|nr:PDZ domain-containing protein [candidate division Zixibacteria bacterium]MDD5426186.1 PDZ domain-containing protein [candidate division Zixibacteria bacterium]